MTTITTINAVGDTTRITDYNGDGAADWVEQDTQEDGEGRVTETRFDDDANGIVDRTERYVYGAQAQADAGTISQYAVGHRIEVQFDDDYTGGAFTADRIEQYGYDAQGRTTRVSIDSDADGTAERVLTYSNFDAGRPGRAAVDEDADGAAEGLEVYTYNGQGRLTRVEFDDNDDGVNERIESYTYNAGGRVTRTDYDDDGSGRFAGRADGTIDRAAFDDNADLTVDRTEAYTRNAGGQVTRTDYDNDADGAVDRVERYAYGAQAQADAGAISQADVGRRIETQFDDDYAAGAFSADRIEHYGYDDQGRVVRVSLDIDADGTVERVLTYSHFDAAGPGRAAVDEDADGTADGREVYAYDGQGRLSRVAYDDNDDGVNERIEHYRRNAGGRVTRTDYDDDADGGVDRVAFDDNADFTVDRTEAYTRNAGGQVTRTAFDDDADGTADRTETYTRNAAGQVTGIDFDDDNDGAGDRVEIYALDEAGRAREKVMSELPFSYRILSGGPFSDINVGDDDGRAAPTFADLDGDGDLDLAVGAKNGTLTYYRNDDGTFLAQSGEANPFNGIDVGDNAVPALADLDGDGDLDLVVGAKNGALTYYRNDDGAFQMQTGAAGPLGGINVGKSAAPALADLDGDGDLDLVVGAKNGALTYYRNDDGAFQMQTSTANPFNGINPGKNAAPALADLDGDGDLDLLVGNKGGAFHYYENTGTAAVPAFTERTGETNPLDGLDAGDNSAPTFADVDGGGMPELVVGVRTGSLQHYPPAAQREIYTRNSAGQVIKTRFDDDNDGTVDRTESYTYDAGGGLTHTRYDEDNDGVYGRLGLHTNAYADDVPDAIIRYRRDANGRLVGIDEDEDGDGAYDLVTNYGHNAAGYRTQVSTVRSGRTVPQEVAYYRDDGERLAFGRDRGDADGVMDIFSYTTISDVVSELQAVAAVAAAGVLAVDANDLTGVPRIVLAGESIGSTDLTLSDAALAVLAGGNASHRLRIDGDRDDVLRFDMDDFTEGTATVAVRGEAYRQFFSGTTSTLSFIVDPDVTLLGIGESRPALSATGTNTLDGEDRIIRTDFDDDGDGHIDRSHFDPDGDGTVDRSESYSRNAAGGLTHTRYDDDHDGWYDRYGVHHRDNPEVIARIISYRRNEAGWIVDIDTDQDGDGAADSSVHVERDASAYRTRVSSSLAGSAVPRSISYYSEDGEQLAAGRDRDDPDSLMDDFSYSDLSHVASEIQATAAAVAAGVLVVDANVLVGVPRIVLAGGSIGSTDLTISDAALGVLAGGDADYQLRIDGDWEDTLRFDLDAFTRGDDVAVGRENYEQYVGTTGSFIVDPDIALVDI